MSPEHTEVITNEEQLMKTLRIVKNEAKYYPSLNPEDPEAHCLRALAKRGLIHWCPYPEEFYKITPKGTKLLASNILGIVHPPL